MRVCLDCVPFLVRSAGVKAYLFQLNKYLRLTAGENIVSSFPWLNHVDSFHHEGSVLSTFPTAARIALLHFFNLPGNHALDFVCRGFDVFHTSNQVRNPPRNVLLTTTIHDTTAWSHPELHTAGTILADMRLAAHTVARCSGIVTPSESTRQDAIRWLGIAPDRVRAIHHGIAESYFQPVYAEPVRTHFGLRKPYILFVSTIEPRKNLDRLLDAYAALGKDVRDAFDLVVAGPKGWASEKTMARLAMAGPSVRYLGYVPEQYLPGLTGGATVFAYPSLYEGFGFPAAQAMAVGTPVITSNVSSLPEVVGEAGVLVNPLSTEELRSALQLLLTSPSRRANLALRGKERAARFRWERCARETWEFFEAL